MILDSIKNHLNRHVSKDMFNALVSIFQSQNINRKIILGNKLKSIKMTKSNIVTNYFMKIK